MLVLDVRVSVRVRVRVRVRIRVSCRLSLPLYWCVSCWSIDRLLSLAFCPPCRVSKKKRLGLGLGLVCVVLCCVFSLFLSRVYPFFLPIKCRGVRLS